MRRVLVVVAAVAAAIAVAVAVAVLTRGGADPVPGDVFPASLGPGFDYVPMSGEERHAFEGSFREASGATAVEMRTVELRGGSSPVGVRVASVVLPAPLDDDGRRTLFRRILQVVPFREPRRDEW